MTASLAHAEEPFDGFCNLAAFGCAVVANDNLSFALLRFQAIHDGARQGAHRDERFFDAGSLPAHFGVSGIGRDAAFLSALDGPSGKIVRREQHQHIPVSNFPMQTRYCIGGSLCWESHPRARVNHPRPMAEATPCLRR